MGKDIAPITRAHLTPILFTIGPPMKQTKLSLAHWISYAVGACQTHTNGKKGVCDGVADIRHLRSCETTTTESLEFLVAFRLRIWSRMNVMMCIPVIASAIAGPQKACTLRSIICVRLCCQTRFQSGTVALYRSMSTWVPFCIKSGVVSSYGLGVATTVLESAMMKIV